MRTKVKIMQHNRVDVRSFLVKNLESTDLFEGPVNMFYGRRFLNRRTEIGSTQMFLGLTFFLGHARPFSRQNLLVTFGVLSAGLTLEITSKF